MWELLTLDRYKDGTIRVLPTLTIDMDGGRYRVTLQDHASHQKLTCTALTLAGVQEALEAALGDGQAEWTKYKSRRVSRIDKRQKADDA